MRLIINKKASSLPVLCNHPTVHRRLLLGMLAALAATVLAPTALGGVAEIRDAQGHLTADAGAVGTFASSQDGGWSLRFDSATRTSHGVSLTGVSLAGGSSTPSASTSRLTGCAGRGSSG